MKTSNILLLSSVILIILFVAGCSSERDSNINTFNGSTIIFQTYGGFIMPDYYRNVFMITPSSITHTTYASNGSVTSNYSKNITSQSYDVIMRSLAENDFTKFNPTYGLPRGVYVADAGDANLTVIASATSKTVMFEPYVDDYYPGNVKNVLNSIRTIIDEIIVNEQSSYVNISFQPMQCQTTPWDAWLANSSIRFIKAPTPQEVITMYYGLEEFNVTLKDIQVINTSQVTCQACGVCPKGYKITAQVELKDLPKMIETGWQRV